MHDAFQLHYTWHVSKTFYGTYPAYLSPEIFFHEKSRDLHTGATVMLILLDTGAMNYVISAVVHS